MTDIGKILAESIKGEDRYQIRIVPDHDAQSPRENDNLSHFAFDHKRHNLADEGQEFDSNDYDHWDEVEQMLRDGRDAELIVPVSMTDHSGLSFNIGEPRDGWDSGMIGFAWMSKDELGSNFGGNEKAAIEAIEQELDAYESWINGGYCGYEIVDSETGEVIDSLWGINSEDVAQEMADAALEKFKKTQ